ncbi:MAG: hypothetical protein PHX35_02435, partial [Candidatus Bipolaricaulis anaerobius]|nr:hypothetical protein [Candidatus Bipolaricaulis anaerobius]
MSREPSPANRNPGPEAGHRPGGRGPRIGVFVCHCGKNIAATVDVERVVEAIAHYPRVVYA